MPCKVYIYTLGCRLNSLESEGIAEAFVQNGFEISKEIKTAELFIINSCAVTSKAEQKARRMMRLFLTSAPVIVTGCYASSIDDKTLSSHLGLLTVPNSEKQILLALPKTLKKYEKIDSSSLKIAYFDAKTSQEAEKLDVFSFFPKNFTYHSRSMLKIQDGCDKFCSFCRTSIVRGRPLSLPSSEVLRRIEELQESGVKEIVLTGVNLALYNDKNVNFSSLLALLLPHLREDVLLRTSSLEPDLIDDKFFDVIKDEHIAPHFHLPIQSVSDKVLSLTGRKYNADRLAAIVENLRKSKGDPFISADIIAGLPGEDDKAFSQTYDFLEKQQFSYLHVFPFSPRPGTKYEHIPHPPEFVRDQRAQVLRALSDRLYRSYYKKFIGKTVSAIAENFTQSCQYFTTSNYLKVSKKISQSFPKIPSGNRVEIIVE